MDANQKLFLDKATAAAAVSFSPFPAMVACEAALESRYGTSDLATEDNNLFGVKEHQHPQYGIAHLPTREFEGGTWIEVHDAAWEKYPTWADCFKDRLATLQRLAPSYSHYSRALLAPTAQSYIVEVSQTWSTDPGWECTCGAQFLSEAAATQHAASHAAAGGGKSLITRIPGLGRALKVLAIFKEYQG